MPQDTKRRARTLRLTAAECRLAADAIDLINARLVEGMTEREVIHLSAMFTVAAEEIEREEKEESDVHAK